MDFKKFSDAVKVTNAMNSGQINAKDMIGIVQTASKFQSSIVLHVGNKIVDVKSFLGLSVSLISKSSPYKLEIHGNDEDEAKAEMKAAFKEYGIEVEI